MSKPQFEKFSTPVHKFGGQQSLALLGWRVLVQLSTAPRACRVCAVSSDTALDVVLLDGYGYATPWAFKHKVASAALVRMSFHTQLCLTNILDDNLNLLCVHFDLLCVHFDIL